MITLPKNLCIFCPVTKTDFIKKRNIMGKGKDSKKSVKKEAAMTPKEKKAAKRLKKNSSL